MKDFSVVIPVYNDEEVLPELYKRLKPVMCNLAETYEIIFVDDGSRDRSVEVLKKLQHDDRNIKIIKLARNFGQANSIAAGLDHAKGDIVVLMDSDLQDRPEDIPKLVEALTTSNSSMAIARWVSRQDSLFKKLVSALFYKVSEWITNIHHSPQLGVFRAIRKNVLKEIMNIPEKTGTTLSLLYWSGFDYVTVDLKRDARYAGTSGYNLKSMLKITCDRIFSYSLFPIRLAIFMGGCLGVLSIICGIILTLRRFLFGNVAAGWTSIIVLLLFLFGVNFMFMGIIGEYLGRVYLEAKGRPKYIIENYIDLEMDKNKND